MWEGGGVSVRLQHFIFLTPAPTHIPPSVSSSSSSPIPILTSHPHHTYPHHTHPLLSSPILSPFHHPSLAPSSSILSYPLPPSSHIPSLLSPSHHPILTPHPLPPSQVRASSELERQQVVSEVRRQAEAEKEIAIAETKKKKWVMKALMCCT